MPCLQAPSDGVRHKTKRPFINCGFCAARVFYNGSGAIRRLKRRMKKMKRQNQDPEGNRKGKRNE
jgi:hypothetical protein